jgi:hypothetical protein
VAARRQQARDARGRFASGGGSGGGGGGRKAKPKATGGTLAARSSLSRSRKKLATNASAAQKGAVTRATKKLSQSRQENRRSVAGGIKGPGVVRKRRGGAAQQQSPSNGIRPTGRPGPRNSIRRYNPATPDGKFNQIDRQIDRTMKDMVNETKRLSRAVKKAKPSIDRMNRKLERSNARSIADRSKKGIDGEIARIELSTVGSGPGMKAIRRRAARAAEAAARGSKPARRAQEIYGNQMAGTGPGKPKAAKNNLRPGPRNTQGPPKKRRRNRKG